MQNQVGAALDRVQQPWTQQTQLPGPCKYVKQSHNLHTFAVQVVVFLKSMRSDVLGDPLSKRKIIQQRDTVEGLPKKWSTASGIVWPRACAKTSLQLKLQGLLLCQELVAAFGNGHCVVDLCMSWSETQKVAY